MQSSTVSERTQLVNAFWKLLRFNFLICGKETGRMDMFSWAVDAFQGEKERGMWSEQYKKSQMFFTVSFYTFLS